MQVSEVLKAGASAAAKDSKEAAAKTADGSNASAAEVGKEARPAVKKLSDNLQGTVEVAAGE